MLVMNLTKISTILFLRHFTLMFDLEVDAVLKSWVLVKRILLFPRLIRT